MDRVFVLVLVLVIASISGFIHLANVQESYAVKQYKNETIGIEFLYPDDWYIVDSRIPDNNKSVAIAPVPPELYDTSSQAPSPFADTKYRTGINIFEVQDDNDILRDGNNIFKLQVVKNTTELYKDTLADRLDIAFMWENKLINNTLSLLGASTDNLIESHLVEYDYDLEKHPYPWKKIVYLFMNENKDKVYSIEIETSLGQYYVNTDNFNTILDSLKLINQKDS